MDADITLTIECIAPGDAEEFQDLLDEHVDDDLQARCTPHTEPPMARSGTHDVVTMALDFGKDAMPDVLSVLAIWTWMRRATAAGPTITMTETGSREAHTFRASDFAEERDARGVRKGMAERMKAGLGAEA